MKEIQELLDKWEVRVTELKYQKTFQHQTIKNRLDVQIREVRRCMRDIKELNNNLTDEVRAEVLLCNSCGMPINADERVRDTESDGEYMHVKCAVEESENEGFDDYMERRK
jgi:uncharacterized coiled-coil protein SlyX